MFQSITPQPGKIPFQVEPFPVAGFAHSHSAAVPEERSSASVFEAIPCSDVSDHEKSEAKSEISGLNPFQMAVSEEMAAPWPEEDSKAAQAHEGSSHQAPKSWSPPMPVAKNRPTRFAAIFGQ